MIQKPDSQAPLGMPRLPPLPASVHVGLPRVSPAGGLEIAASQSMEVLGFLRISLDFLIFTRIFTRILQGNYGPRRSWEVFRRS